MSSNSETDRALEYHEKTKHSYWSVRTTPHYLDWENKPSPFKVYPEIEAIPLPRDLVRTNAPAIEAIGFKTFESSSVAVPDLERLAAVLFFSAGVTKHKSYPGGDIYFRAAACAGALYPVETYVVTRDIEGLDAGVYHFNPGDFSLRRLREGDYRDHVAHAAGEEENLASAPVILIYTAITWRSSWKYRSRSYRYHFWDNGTIVANALALCNAHNLPAKLLMGFEDRAINKLIGIDGERELPLSLLAVGSEASESVRVREENEVSDLDHRAIPLSDQQSDFPIILEMHRASSLSDSVEAASWRNVSHEETRQAPAGELLNLAAVRPESIPSVSIEDVILRRASTRRFARKGITPEELSLLLVKATEGIPADFLQTAGMQLNEIYLIANRVDGLEPGAYYHRRQDKSLEQIKRGDFSERAAYLTLEQPLGGDASITVFFMADLKRLLAEFGNRAYRAVQMEAGIIGGKLYIGAYALGRGATGLTFYDDDVTTFFYPHAAGKSCIFVTSIGVPGKRPLY